MYELVEGRWVTPNGRPFIGWYRTDCNDWNTHNSIAGANDEYHLFGQYLTGLVLDVGGYLGTFGICAAIDFPGTTVTIVEPVPQNIDMIRRNIEANGLGERVSIVEGAVGNGTPVTLRWAYQMDESSLHHAFVGNAYRDGKPNQGEHSELVVPTFRIADLVPDTASIKIDCEGGEWEFLDSPDVSRLTQIVGEWHPTPFADGSHGTRARFEALLSATHDITFDGPDSGPAGFTAIRR